MYDDKVAGRDAGGLSLLSGAAVFLVWRNDRHLIDGLVAIDALVLINLRDGWHPVQAPTRSNPRESRQGSSGLP